MAKRGPHFRQSIFPNEKAKKAKITFLLERISYLKTIQKWFAFILLNFNFLQIKLENWKLNCDGGKKRTNSRKKKNVRREKITYLLSWFDNCGIDDWNWIEVEIEIIFLWIHNDLANNVTYHFFGIFISPQRHFTITLMIHFPRVSIVINLRTPKIQCSKLNTIWTRRIVLHRINGLLKYQFNLLMIS